MTEYVCMLMGYELLVLVVRFGLICEVLVKYVNDFENLVKWCYEPMINEFRSFLLCMLTVGEVCTTVLGQLRSKLGFLGSFCVSSREGTHFWVPLCCAACWARCCVPWPDVLNSTCCYAHLGPFWLFPDIPECSFCGVLMLFWWIKLLEHLLLGFEIVF